MTLEEQETTITYDYARKTVRYYTTRRNVYEKVLKRVGAGKVTIIKATDHDWAFTVPMSLCRCAATLTKAGTRAPMTDEQKAVVRERFAKAKAAREVAVEAQH